ncbi:MAG: hypothetical protein RL768_2252 [Nitrospirota bacterium]|jgi:hypothetical protein
MRIDEDLIWQENVFTGVRTKDPECSVEFL